MAKPLFDSPSSRLIGSCDTVFDEASGIITMGFVAPESFASPRGFVQGGLVPAFLDEVMGGAVYHASGGELLPLNLDMNVSFLRPVPIGSLTGTGRVVKMGRNVAYIEGELLDPDGRPLARATSTAMLTPVPGGAD